MTTVHWFRRDLRLSDNPALLEAVRRAGDDGVVGLFVVDPVLWRSASPRLDYLAASLRALDDSLGGRLVVRTGVAADVVPRIAAEVQATSVHVTAATEPYGRARDDAVARALARFATETELVATGSPYAVAPGRLRTAAGTPFQVFTPFRRAWLDHGWALPAARPQPATWLTLASDGVPAAPATDVQLPAAGERAALDRWRRFVDDGLADYATDRDRPAIEGTSAMSAPLKFGEVHPRTLLSALADDDGSRTYRSELAWREFHADVLWHAPDATHRSLRAVVPDDAWVGGDDWFDAWRDGRTGYPLVDAGMRQLRATGWMHNRVRMVVASFLVKDLHIRWQRGARHFMAWLVDGDVAQNQLNWQWVAGTGRDAAPYFRVFNPVLQGEKFDPDGSYVRRWVPELRAVPGVAVHQPWRLDPAAAPDYPARIVDHAVERAVTLEAYGAQRGV